MRSSSQLPPLAVGTRPDDDQTEPVTQRPPMVQATRSRRLPPIVWLVAALLPGVGILALQYVRTAPAVSAARTAEADSIAELVTTMFDGDARAAQVRVEAIASSSMLRTAIQTDASTLQDMARDKDITFALGAGESLEVFQSSSGSRTPLIKIPATGPEITPPPAGTARLELRGGAVNVVVGAQVQPPNGHGVGGEIALVAPIDLARLKTHPAEHLSGVALVGFATPIPLGSSAPADGGTPITVPVATSLAKGPPLSITATLAAAAAGNDKLLDEMRYACAGLATLFLIMFGVSLLVRR